MKKKTLVLMMGATMMLAVTACGKEEVQNTAPAETQESEAEMEETPEVVESEETKEVAVESGTLEEILVGITSDYEAAIQKLTTEKENVVAGVGDTYEDYVKNEQLVTDWYTLVLTEEEALFERTTDNAIAYFKLISETVNHEDYDAWDDAMDEFYDVVYEDAMEAFYENIYEDAMENMYDTYYDGIVAEGCDTVEYSEWSDVSGKCYEEWSDASGDIYETWSDFGSDLYEMWSDVSGEFYDGNFDMETFFAKDTTDATESAENESTADTKSDTSSDGIDPKFKEMLDSYEAFFDEYIEFMKKYANAGAEDMVGMMQDYTNYMTQYTETMQKLSALENEEMSTEETLYYTEVSARITQKLLEVQSGM